MIVLGINPAADSSSAIAVNGHVIHAVAEERISRIKHHAHRFCASARHVLKLVNVSIRDLSLVVICRHGLAESMKDDSCRQFLDEIERSGVPVEIVESHHYLHACSTFFQSPFSEAAILVLDGLGTHASFLPSEYQKILENPEILLPGQVSSAHESASLWVAEGSGLRPMAMRFATNPAGAEAREDMSIGQLYGSASRQLFASRFDAGKLMALAAFGAPLSDPLLSATGGTIQVTEHAARLFSERQTRHSRETLAASAQSAVEQVVLQRARQARATTGKRHLCVAGGIFLNCVANHRLQREGLFDSIYCPSAPSDDGIAIGAALHGSFLTLGIDRCRGASSPFIGTPTDTRGIPELSKTLGLTCRPLAGRQRYQAAARALIDEAVIFWHSGHSEFGPRALGNRSILANPFSHGIRNRLNREIKHREDFRPVAPIMTSSATDKYFSSGPTLLTELMLESLAVRPEFSDLLSECLHVDGSARVQTVPVHEFSPVRELLDEFESLSAHPILINTSLNGRDQPICESPEDTLGLFATSSVGTAFIGDFQISKS